MLFGILGSTFIFDFPQIERMVIFIAFLSVLLLMTLISYLKLIIKLHELEEAVYYADIVTNFIGSDKIEDLEKIGIYGTVVTLGEAKKHFCDIENKSINTELKRL